MVKYRHGHSTAERVPVQPGSRRTVSSKLKRKLTLALVAIIAVAAAGGAYAATQSSSGSSRQAFLNDVAKRLNVAPAQLTSALQGAYADRLAAEVAAGRLTQAQANAIEQRIKSSGVAPVLGLGGHGAGWGAGNWGGAVKGLPRAPRLGRFGAHGDLGAVASYLGLSNAKLLGDLRAGKSLTQIAASQHKTAAGLRRALASAFGNRFGPLDQPRRLAPWTP